MMTSWIQGGFHFLINLWVYITIVVLIYIENLHQSHLILGVSMEKGSTYNISQFTKVFKMPCNIFGAVRDGSITYAGGR